MKIYLISDMHLFHQNMVPYCGRPVDHTEQLIRNWNNIVTPDDLVIHLGDIIFGLNKEENLTRVMNRLMGRKISVRGNHDPKSWKWYMEAGFDFVCDSFVYGKFAFSHCPLTPLPKQANFNWKKEVEICFHGHFHNNPPKKESIGRDGNRDLYDLKYYFDNEEKYQLIQIETTLAPILLDDVLESIGWKDGDNK